MKKLVTFLMLLAFLNCCEKNHPPNCEIISPGNGSEIMRGELVTLSVDANDSDGSVQEVRLYIDDELIASFKALPYTFSWETDGVELGGYDIRAVAVDDDKVEGETSIEIEIIQGIVDEIKPTVKLISPVEESTVRGTINIVAKVMDNVGVEYVDFMIKEDDWVVFEKDSTSAYFEFSASLNTTKYPDGLRMLSIAGYDAAGNYGEYSFNVFIDNSGDTEVPVVEIFAPQNNQTVSGHITFRAKATDNIGIDHVDFKILDGTWVLLGTDYYSIGDNEYSLLWDTRNTPDGIYGIKAVAWDSAANEGIDRIGITIDNSGSVAGDDSFIYDRRKYHFKTIGTQTWMTENLAYWPIGGSSGGSYRVYDQSSDRDIARHSDNYKVYGVLYNWAAAQTACPPGWHLPSDEEWKTLEKYLGMSSSDADDLGFRNSGDVGRKLKYTSGWTGDGTAENGNGDNTSGFQAIPGGYRDIDGGGFVNLGSYASFWTSSSIIEVENAFCRYLRYESDGVYRSAVLKNYGFSIRCIKDD